MRARSAIGLFLAGLAAASLPLSGCAQKSPADLSVSNAKIYAPLPGRDVAMGVFTISNSGGTSDTLVKASSPNSALIEIHTHIKEDKIMKMRRVDGVEIKPGASVEFKSGSYHLMMFVAKIADDTAQVPVTLSFKTSPDLKILADITAR